MIKRIGYITLGWLSLILGIVGAVLPILPTTPFVLLSAYCFSKGSQKLHAWLLAQPKLGQMIYDWEQKGAIRRSAKITATIMIVLMMGYALIFKPMHLGFKAAIAVTMIGVLTFIWTRPDGA